MSKSDWLKSPHGHTSKELTMTTYYTLTDQTPGTTLNIEGNVFVVTDPRKMPISDFDAFPNGLDLILNCVLRLARVTPTGTAKPFEDEPQFYDAEAWTVDALESINGVLGPQAHLIIPALRLADETLRGDPEANAAASSYYQATDAQYDTPNWLIQEEFDAAAEALSHYGADGFWWTNEVRTCTYGTELVALAARDLIGTVDGWTREAFDELVKPWRAAFGEDQFVEKVDAMTTYTHPTVLTEGVRDGWADPETDPARIDWRPRQAHAAIQFNVVNGRPVNPCQKTGIEHGRNELGHWGEQLAADALVYLTDNAGRRWILMVERGDGHGWALPGGYVDPADATPTDAAIRELAEETGLHLRSVGWTAAPPQYVTDPRASDESWMVTVVCTTDLGTVERFPEVKGADDARRAAWVPADTYAALTSHLAETYDGQVFPAHAGILKAIR